MQQHVLASRYLAKAVVLVGASLTCVATPLSAQPLPPPAPVSELAAEMPLGYARMTTWRPVNGQWSFAYAVELTRPAADSVSARWVQRGVTLTPRAVEEALAQFRVDTAIAQLLPLAPGGAKRVLPRGALLRQTDTTNGGFAYLLPRGMREERRIATSVIERHGRVEQVSTSVELRDGTTWRLETMITRRIDSLGVEEALVAQYAVPKAKASGR